MAVLPWTDERREALRAAAPQPEPPAPPRNLGAVLDLGRGSLLWYRGVPLLVPPLPYRLGLEMQATLLELATYRDGGVTAERLDEYTALIERAVELCERAVLPVRRRDRVLRWLGRWHPLRDATEGEVGELLPFCFAHRTRSGIRLSPDGGAAPTS